MSFFFCKNFFSIKERLNKQLRSKGQKNSRLFYSEKFETQLWSPKEHLIISIWCENDLNWAVMFRSSFHHFSLGSEISFISYITTRLENNSTVANTQILLTCFLLFQIVLVQRFQSFISAWELREFLLIPRIVNDNLTWKYLHFMYTRG